MPLDEGLAVIFVFFAGEAGLDEAVDFFEGSVVGGGLLLRSRGGPLPQGEGTRESEERGWSGSPRDAGTGGWGWG